MTYLVIFIIGLVVGSFLNVLIDRLPSGKTILGRSHCDHCKKQLRRVDLIPLGSFFLLGGKCRYCKKPLSWQYPLVEFITGVFFVISWIYLPTINLDVNVQNQLILSGQNQLQNLITRIFYLGITASLVAIFFVDLKYQIIPDSLQVALLFFALAIGLIARPELGFIAKKAGDGLLVMLPILFLFLITRGRGMGFGDVKLAFTMGILLGMYGGFIAEYLGFVFGGIAGIVLLLLRRKKMKSAIAFGPFLVMGTFLTLVFKGPLLLNLFYLLNSWAIR